MVPSNQSFHIASTSVTLQPWRGFLVNHRHNYWRTNLSAIGASSLYLCSNQAWSPFPFRTITLACLTYKPDCLSTSEIKQRLDESKQSPHIVSGLPFRDSSSNPSIWLTWNWCQARYPDGNRLPCTKWWILSPSAPSGLQKAEVTIGYGFQMGYYDCALHCSAWVNSTSTWSLPDAFAKHVVLHRSKHFVNWVWHGVKPHGQQDFIHWGCPFRDNEMRWRNEVLPYIIRNFACRSSRDTGAWTCLGLCIAGPHRPDRGDPKELHCLAMPLLVEEYQTSMRCSLKFIWMGPGGEISKSLGRQRWAQLNICRDCRRVRCTADCDASMYKEESGGAVLSHCALLIVMHQCMKRKVLEQC